MPKRTSPPRNIIPFKQPAGKRGPASAKTTPAKDAPRCGLCGKQGSLWRTECCGNWVCADPQPLSRKCKRCYYNHKSHTVCSFHYIEKHPGPWQDCLLCPEQLSGEFYAWCATNEFNLEPLENPPPFEPTLCAQCGERINMVFDAYAMLPGKGFFCATCCKQK